ncbi:hypothetical protein [Pseudogemmobacter bohemicus]|uniref:hypothetical protein n=1 Tax=Pseudogemmobacter bohemicus TaxID=2250708 RepID=UPI001300953E|nr:hypothetical protein [Pseudogemmobacter bohemicus]
MCLSTPKISTPAVQRMAAPTSDIARREGELERTLRRQRAGVAADVLTSPLGVVGGAG